MNGYHIGMQESEAVREQRELSQSAKDEEIAILINELNKLRQLRRKHSGHKAYHTRDPGARILTTANSVI